MFLEDRTEQVRLASARDTLLRVRAATFDNLFEAISVFASDGRLYLWNRRFRDVWDLEEERLTEHPRVDELIPAMARKLVNPTAAAQIREMVRQTTNERQSSSGRISLTDGRHFEFAAVPLPDGNALFTMVDVTDSTRIQGALRERAEALEEADRVKTDFVANMVVLPGLSLPSAMPDDEWDALEGEETHPQFHLRMLLDRIGVARGEVQLWPSAGRAAAPAVRTRAIAHAMTAADFSDKWNQLKPSERRLTGIRAAELPDPSGESQAIALAIREALETAGQTVALVTPDRLLARRVSVLLGRWGIEADDSAGRALSKLPPGTLLLAMASAAAEQFAPVALLALLKHPLVGGEDAERRSWIDDVRLLDHGPSRPTAEASGAFLCTPGHRRAVEAIRCR